MALILAQHVDATVLVNAAGATGRKQLAEALTSLRGVEAPLLGAILNKVTWEAGYGEARYYGDAG